MKIHVLKHKRLVGTAIVAAVALLVPLKAQILGIGSLVFDPTSFAKLVQQYTQQVEQYARQAEQLAQEIQTAENTLNHYKLAVQQAQYFSNKQLWQAISNTLWRDSAQNVLGETAQWNGAINGNPGLAPVAWSNATTALGNPGWLHGESVGTSPTVSDLATVEIDDATSINTLRTLADYRNAQIASGPALAKLESDALDPTAETNVQVRQLNLEAAGTVQMLRSQQNIIDVLGYQLEQQLMVNKPVRDGIAATLSRYSAMQAYQQTEATAIASPQATFVGYQIP